LTLPLGTLLGKDVSQMRLGAFKAAFAGAAKTLRSPAITFHLGHY
jgi:hypothetical protein